MRLDTYRSLLAVGAGLPITTSEVAARLGTSLPTASRVLADLVRAGAAHRIRPGLFLLGESAPDPLVIGPSLTLPAPAYVSFASALHFHGIVDQIPRRITLASIGRPRVLETDIGTYVVHRIAPEVFGGWRTVRGVTVARPEKALFDTAYVAAVRGEPALIPELDLPPSFDRSAIEHWSTRIPSARLRTMTRDRIERLLARAVR